MAELYTWLGDASGTSRGVWYLFGMVAQQIFMSTLLGIMFANAWTTTPIGTKVLLACIIVLQLMGILWTAAKTANDRIDGLQNCIVYSLECAASCLVFASAIVADQARTADGEVDVKKLAESLSMTALSGQMLLTAVFFPMSVTVYNSFVVPIFQKMRSGDGSMVEIGCQIIMTCVLLPYEMVTTFFGCGGLGAAADVVAEMERSAIELTSSAAEAKSEAADDEEEEEEAEEEALKERLIKAPPSAGAKKRMKRAMFVARVRERTEASLVKYDVHTPSAAQ